VVECRASHVAVQLQQMLVPEATHHGMQMHACLIAGVLQHSYKTLLVMCLSTS
jgi:hypothetical protein